jgi:hypothetical protein
LPASAAVVPASSAVVLPEAKSAVIDVSDDMPSLESDDCAIVDRPINKTAIDIGQLRRDVERLEGGLERLAISITAREIDIRMKKAQAEKLKADIRRASAC